MSRHLEPKRERERRERGERSTDRNRGLGGRMKEREGRRTRESRD